MRLFGKEFMIEIGGRDRRCILYYVEDESERDRKSVETLLAKVREGLVGAAVSANGHCFS